MQLYSTRFVIPNNAHNWQVMVVLLPEHRPSMNLVPAVFLLTPMLVAGLGALRAGWLLTGRLNVNFYWAGTLVLAGVRALLVNEVVRAHCFSGGLGVGVGMEKEGEGKHHE